MTSSLLGLTMGQGGRKGQPQTPQRGEKKHRKKKGGFAVSYLNILVLGHGGRGQLDAGDRGQIPGIRTYRAANRG